SSARVVDTAMPALSPIRPAKTRTVMIAATVSLLLGILGAVLFYRLRDTVRTTDDVESKLQRPLLAALPILPRRTNKNRGHAVLDEPLDLYAESIRVVSAQI